MHKFREPDITAERAIFGMGLPSFVLTYIRDVSTAELLRRIGANEATPRLLTLVESDSLVDYEKPGSLMRFGTTGGWSFCFETWGILGASDWGLRRMSSGTEAFSYLSGGDGMDIVQSWKDKRPVELFEPGSFGSLRAHKDHLLWDAAHRYRDLLADPQQPGATHIAALKAIHDRVQAHITPELIANTLPSVWLPETSAMRRCESTPMPPVARQAPSRPLGAFLGSLQPPPVSGLSIERCNEGG